MRCDALLSVVCPSAIPQQKLDCCRYGQSMLNTVLYFHFITFECTKKVGKVECNMSVTYTIIS